MSYPLQHFKMKTQNLAVKSLLPVLQCLRYILVATTLNNRTKNCSFSVYFAEKEENLYKLSSASATACTILKNSLQNFECVYVCTRAW